MARRVGGKKNKSNPVDLVTLRWVGDGADRSPRNKDRDNKTTEIEKEKEYRASMTGSPKQGK